MASPEGQPGRQIEEDLATLQMQQLATRLERVETTADRRLTDLRAMIFEVQTAIQSLQGPGLPTPAATPAAARPTTPGSALYARTSAARVEPGGMPGARRAEREHHGGRDDAVESREYQARRDRQCARGLPDRFEGLDGTVNDPYESVKTEAFEVLLKFKMYREAMAADYGPLSDGFFIRRLKANFCGEALTWVNGLEAGIQDDLAEFGEAFVEHYLTKDAATQALDELKKHTVSGYDYNVSKFLIAFQKARTIVEALVPGQYEELIRKSFYDALTPSLKKDIRHLWGDQSPYPVLFREVERINHAMGPRRPPRRPAARTTPEAFHVVQTPDTAQIFCRCGNKWPGELGTKQECPKCHRRFWASRRLQGKPPQDAAVNCMWAAPESDEEVGEGDHETTAPDASDSEGSGFDC
jgi:hypothetical protein